MAQAIIFTDEYAAVTLPRPPVFKMIIYWGFVLYSR